MLFRSIDIDKLQSNNLNDLIIKTTTIETKNIKTKDDCIEKKKSIKDSKRWKYNGSVYQ